ncbi:MAG: hypothetical protein KJ799_15910 [Bacteroidetes bacterium]|nr:hypothetical protein [Bacteroidota bacterium]
MNVASIDIGSNTVLLLIAEVDVIGGNLKPLINRYEIPRISKGLKPGGKISEDKICLLIDILQQYKEIANRFDCAEVLVNATNAMRIASNSLDITNKAKAETGFSIDVIVGEQEAYYSYLGAVSSFRDFEDNCVIDIGGSSTELIFGNKDAIKYKKSFQIGAVSLTEKFVENYPVSIDALNEMRQYAANIFSALPSSIERGLNSIAVAGTPTTLSCMVQGLKDYSEEKIEKSILSGTDLNNFIDEFSELIPSDILRKYGKIVEGREDIILAGTIILNTIRQIIAAEIIYVSGRGLRYGAVEDMILRLQKSNEFKKS